MGPRGVLRRLCEERSLTIFYSPIMYHRQSRTDGTITFSYVSINMHGYPLQTFSMRMRCTGRAKTTSCKCDIRQFLYTPNKLVSQMRAPLGGLSRTSIELWQTAPGVIWFWTQNVIFFKFMPRINVAAFWYFGISVICSHTFRRVKFVMIPTCFV